MLFGKAFSFDRFSTLFETEKKPEVVCDETVNEVCGDDFRTLRGVFTHLVPLQALGTASPRVGRYAVVVATCWTPKFALRAQAVVTLLLGPQPISVALLVKRTACSVQNFFNKHKVPVPAQKSVSSQGSRPVEQLRSVPRQQLTLQTI